jgi:hypothetical protein
MTFARDAVLWELIMRKCSASFCMVLFAGAILFAESAAGVRWTAPAGWKAEGPRPMRAATYTVPAAAGDTSGGEVVINYFGPGQGGTVDANIERWTNQMQGSDAKPAAAKVAKRTVHGLAMTTIDSSGAYSGMGGPMAPSGKVVPGYRLLGAIVEGPGGNVFVKFTGPAKTVAANAQKFEQLLSSFSPDK